MGSKDSRTSFIQSAMRCFGLKKESDWKLPMFLRVPTVTEMSVAVHSRSAVEYRRQIAIKPVAAAEEQEHHFKTDFFWGEQKLKDS